MQPEILIRRYIELTQQLVSSLQSASTSDWQAIFDQRSELLGELGQLSITPDMLKGLEDAQEAEQILQVSLTSELDEIKTHLMDRFRARHGLGGYKSGISRRGDAADEVA